MTHRGTRNPEDIKRDVRLQLSSDNRLGRADIRVEVSDGTVVLSGTVPTYSDKQSAEEDAYAISGVIFVDNRLTVSPPSMIRIPRDKDIAARLTKMLKWNPAIDASRIRVSVADGIVTLTGSACSSWEKAGAGQLAENVTGVMRVDNLLKVEPGASVQDRQIERELRESLDRNIFVDASRVVIIVKDGVVTLKGTVDKHHAFRTAQDIANYTGGVVSVNNELVVTG